MVTPLETKLDFKDAGIEEGSGRHPTNGTKIHLGGFPKNRKKEPRFVVFPGHEDCLPVDFKTFCLLILFFGKR
ncbi:hypothetical protein RIR_jg2086.t2 [Rhizophagus irregularis DAOM 181602=DAOM 197198]|nr:hypothetical protein RIR_jg2086.t2 [Rhizophagus irregularis DAOM 181602=DAOM 197198]